MTLSDFQRALGDCLADREFRNTVMRDPVDALAGYTLTNWERGRLITTLGRSFTTRTGAPGHLAFVHETLPLTCTILGGTLRATVDACWLERASLDLDSGADGVRFAAFLQTRLSESAFDIPWLRDVLAFETAALELTSISPVAVQPSDVPMLHPRVRLVRFNTEPKTLLTRVWSGESTSQLPRSEHWLLLDGRKAPAEARDLTRTAGRALAQVKAGKLAAVPMLAALVSLGLVVPSVHA